MVPDAYYKNIYEIDYNKLYKKGIRYIFFDIDNTLLPYTDSSIKYKTKKKIEELEKKFKILVISNSRSKRVKRITSELNIDGYYKSMKPLKKTYKKILKKYDPNKCIFIGDQFMTDVIGAKRNNLKIILVDRILNIEPITTKIFRFFEKRITNKYKKTGKFEFGKYYDNIN